MYTCTRIHTPVHTIAQTIIKVFTATLSTVLPTASIRSYMSTTAVRSSSCHVRTTCYCSPSSRRAWIGKTTFPCRNATENPLLRPNVQLPCGNQYHNTRINYAEQYAGSGCRDGCSSRLVDILRYLASEGRAQQETRSLAGGANAHRRSNLSNVRRATQIWDLWHSSNDRCYTDHTCGLDVLRAFSCLAGIREGRWWCRPPRMCQFWMCLAVS